MKVLHIITGLENGGAEGALYRLCASDKENEHQIVSLMDKGVYGNKYDSIGIALFCLNMPRGKITLKGFIKLVRLIRTNHHDIVQTWMYHADFFGGICSLFAGNTSIFWGIRNSYISSEDKSKKTLFIAKLCAVLSYIIPKKIISCSYQATKLHESMGYKSSKMITIPNGYDLNRLLPDLQGGLLLREEWKIKSDTIIIGMVARWDPMKDHASLIAALEKLNMDKQFNWICVLVGSNITNENVQLVELIKKSNLENKIRLLGQRDDINRIMSALNIHVLSSSSEAFPNVVAEAMACATPCVATDVGDASLIVADFGWIAQPMDPVDLKNQIRNAMIASTQSESWDKLKNDCRFHILSNFGIEKMVQNYNNAWNKIN